jgi:hypothetical protein
MSVSSVNTWTVFGIFGAFGIFTTEPAHLPPYASLFVWWFIHPFGTTGGFSLGTLMRSTWEDRQSRLGRKPAEPVHTIQSEQDP